MPSFQQKKLQGILEGREHNLLRQQTLETDSEMAGVLELSDQKFKVIMINMLRALMKEEDVTK